MKKHIISGLLMLSIIIPVAVFAQGDVDTNANTSNCVSLQSTNLRYRSRDANTNGEVSTLQDFLESQNYLSTDPTGYFGLLTMKAVENLQSSQGLSPTGYVGSLTKAKISKLSCGIQLDDAIPYTPPAYVPSPTSNSSSNSFISPNYSQTSSTPLSSLEKTVTYTYPSDPCGTLMTDYSTPGSVFVGNGPVSALASQQCTNGSLPDTSTFRTYSCSNSSLNGNIVGSATFAFECTSPVVSSTPKATVDFKINGSDGPVDVGPNAVATLSWTSTGIGNGTCQIDGVGGGAIARNLPSSGSTTVQRISSQELIISCSPTSDFTDVKNLAQDTVMENITSASPLPPGCSSYSGWSLTTGQACSVLITYISPSSAPAGASVAINGSNFDSGSYIEIDGGKTIIPNTVWSTVLNFTVPSNLTVGSHMIQVLEKSGLLSNTIMLYVSSNTLPVGFPAGCASQDGWSSTTGVACNSPLPAGCSSFTGWSLTTGQACDGTVYVPVYPPGCTSYSGVSTTTGGSCEYTKGN